MTPTDGPDALRRHAVALVERLVAVDERMMLLEDETADLRARLSGRPGHRAASPTPFEPPPIVHAWPLAELPEGDPSTFGYYQHRVDDAALLEARRGQAFLQQFRLAEPSPDFAGAVAALRLAGAARPLAAQPPDATILVPIHGQLGWTLNCLHSLLTHASRSSFDIVLVDDASPDESGTRLSALAAAVPAVRLLTLADNAGFIAACNRGAEAARGGTLVLLNNDTRVVPGWLDALLDGFATFPNAGLIGSKLLYPDGRLQEAGCIVWRDGSAWNYGRYDDPNRPQYSHARQVDYVSGASIAVPGALWRALGGFDAHYAPAYGEDSDLAMRIRAAGREVRLQPQSRVIHYEGRTSGTDVEQGVKAHQVVNAKKVFMRWRQQLAMHRRNGEAPYLERERDAVQRALVIDATTPTPKQDAGSVTTTQTLRLLQSLGYKVHFVPQDNFLFEPGHTDALLAAGIECAYAPFDADFPAYIARTGAMFDVVLVYRVGILDRVLADLRRHAPQAPVLFHDMDLHFLRMERQAELDGRASQIAAAAAMRATELALIRQADCTITHSTYERDLLAGLVPEAQVVLWPFMCETVGTEVSFAARRDFCFLGGYRHPPNVDAVAFFAAEVLPRIRRRLPEARFVIAGANPGPEVLALAGDGIEVTGQVEDLRNVFDRVRVFACSVRVGAGTKGKVPTAMAYGLPVVSTSCGAEGMELEDGRDLLIADGAEAFAAACVRAHEDAALWQRLSQAGLALVAAKHSLAMGREVLRHAIETGLSRRLGLS